MLELFPVSSAVTSSALSPAFTVQLNKVAVYSVGALTAIAMEIAPCSRFFPSLFFHPTVKQLFGVVYGLSSSGLQIFMKSLVTLRLGGSLGTG